MIRYNNRAKIINESVAEHSTYVAFNVLKICKLYNISNDVKYRALEMAVVHDIPETYTSDVPWNVKQKSSVLSKELSRLEIEFIKEDMPEIYESFKSYQEAEENKTLEGIIVKLADTLSVVQYCEQEKSLGNVSSEMMEILADGYIRVGTYIENLEEKLKENEVE